MAAKGVKENRINHLLPVRNRIIYWNAGQPLLGINNTKHHQKVKWKNRIEKREDNYISFSPQMQPEEAYFVNP
jgi:hypothetical protein